MTKIQPYYNISPKIVSKRHRKNRKHRKRIFLSAETRKHMKNYGKFKIGDIVKKANIANPLDQPMECLDNFKFPLAKFRVTSHFGYRRNPFGKKKKVHSGMDMAATKGTQVKAANHGKVIFADQYGGYGNLVVIYHKNGDKPYFTAYGHLNKLNVLEGEEILQGTLIGEVGSTGATTGNCLHFEVRDKNGNAMNPLHIKNLTILAQGVNTQMAQAEVAVAPGRTSAELYDEAKRFVLKLSQPKQ